MTKIFKAHSVISTTLEAPLKDLFELSRQPGHEEDTVPAKLTYEDESGTHTLPGKVRVRGNYTRQACEFKKLSYEFDNGDKFEQSIFEGNRKIKIGTHCSEGAPLDPMTQTEKHAHREVFAYRLVEAMGVPTLKTRPAKMTYVDTSPTADHTPKIKDGFLLETDGNAGDRLDAKQIETPANPWMPNPDPAAKPPNLKGFDPVANAKMILVEALVGNMDWIFRPQEGGKEVGPNTWNINLYERADGSRFAMMYDLNLTTFVLPEGSQWFWPSPGYYEGETDFIDMNVDGRMQPVRQAVSREALDQALAELRAKESEALALVASYPDEDAEGKANMEKHLRAFFSRLDDEKFYRPVIIRKDVIPLTDAEGSDVACQTLFYQGGPVRVIETRGNMKLVAGLADNIFGHGICQEQPVWIRDTGDVMTTDYPPKDPPAGMLADE